MSKIPTWRLLEQLDERRALQYEKRKKSRDKSLWLETKTFSRASLDSESKSEILKALWDTQWKVKELLEKLDKWPLEKTGSQKVYLSGWHYSSNSRAKHSSYRVSSIRKIKNQIVSWYSSVTKILDQSSSISYSENLELLWKIYVFDETVSTTLVLDTVQWFQKSIFNILNPILIDLWVLK